MKAPQFPAKNIMQTFENNTTKAYKMSCICQSPDHDIHIWVERDSDSSEISLTFDTQSKSNYWKQYIRLYDRNNDYHKFGCKVQCFLNDYINRIVLSFKLLTTGYIQVETEHLMDEQQLSNFINVLTTASTKAKPNEE